MYPYTILMTHLAVIAALCLINPVQGQNFLLTGPVDSRFLPNYDTQQDSYLSTHETSPFRQNSAFQGLDSYVPQRDLQTSDIPFHLQQTLPQYRFTTKSTVPKYESTFRNTQPHYTYKSIGSPDFRPQHTHFTQNVAPSTHRPNYSHLFAQTHNRNPSETETFLGEITLQNSAELPHPFNKFSNELLQGTHSTFNDPQTRPKPNENNEGNLKISSILNHRTRIFAPDSTDTVERPKTKNYFVNKNGQVFLPSKPPTVPKPTDTTVIHEHLIEMTHRPEEIMAARAPTGKSQSDNILSRNTLNIEPLLEEPVKEYVNSDNDEVEVVKATSKERSASENSKEDEELTDEYDYDVSDENAHSNKSYENGIEPNVNENHNDIHSEEYPGDEEEEEIIEPVSKIIKQITLNNSKLEVMTMKPADKLKSDNFSKFSDSVSIDTTTEETTPTTEISASSNNKPGLVVSVVTTKSVVNNTVIGTATPPSIATDKMVYSTVLENEDNTTDSWVVVASVQTSRSISGAHYLPSPNVAQEERYKILNESEQQSIKPEIEESDTQANSFDTFSTEEVVTSSPITTTKQKTSTESLIDKLDRVQSDLSSGLLAGGYKSDGNNIAVITENMTDKMDVTTMLDVSVTTESSPKPSVQNIHPPVLIKKFSSLSRPSTTPRSVAFKRKFQNNHNSPASVKSSNITVSQNESLGNKEEPKIIVQSVNSYLPAGYKLSTDGGRNSRLVEDLIKKLKAHNKISSISTELPASQVSSNKSDSDYNNSTSQPVSSLDNENNTADNYNKTQIKSDVDMSAALLPPGYKLPKTENTTSGYSNQETSGIESILAKAKPITDISALLPPGYKPPKDENTSSENPTKKPKILESILAKAIPVADISSLLPPGYKLQENESTTSNNSNDKSKNLETILMKAKPITDLSALLPPGYKPNKQTTTPKHKSIESIPNKPIDINAFLPPGYKANTMSKSTESSSLSPPGYKSPLSGKQPNMQSTTEATSTTPTSETPPVVKIGGSKIVFPSRPGGPKRAKNRLTTPKIQYDEPPPMPVTSPTIHKGWPSRATTEFTGWPTPSTTPISIEKLLEAARAASSSTTVEPLISSTTLTTTTTTTTTTQRPTTPGICVGECDIAATIKLIGGAKWVPELLDRNTKEWQILANEVQSQLEDVYTKSNMLNKWYKKIRIDGFSEGSVLVDYLVELNDLGRHIDTFEMKKLFHGALEDSLNKSNPREGKALNETSKPDGKLKLGDFVVDPKFTDFIVLPKEVYPTVGYAEDNVLLPQWAIAVIVIGLASLLFVIIFGVTVLVNRQKNAKKKSPTPLSDDMLNELNKNHMGGLDNYGADDPYNMDDVWNDRGYESKSPKKRSTGSINDNSMANLYDSWRSEWNGYYYNAYYGNNPGSSHSGQGRRRSDYDTNF